MKIKTLTVSIVKKTSCSKEMLDFMEHSLQTLENNLYDLGIENLPKGEGVVEFGLHFVDDGEIKELNGRYRNIPQVTDVLSFPVHENLLQKKEILELAPLNLGDVIICLPQAERQASDHQIDLNCEVAHLLVHGFLHLLGFDHQEEKAAQIMFDLEEKLINDIYQGRQ